SRHFQGGRREIVKISLGELAEKGVLTMKRQTLFILGGAGALLLSGFLLLQAQETATALRSEQLAPAVAEHPECSFFVQRDKINRAGANSGTDQNRLSGLTQQVTSMLSAKS